MTRLELIERLSSANEEDVLIEIDGTLYEIGGIGHVDESFDGFATAFPAAVKLVPKMED